MSELGKISGPGDPERLVTALAVSSGAVLHIEGGDAQQVLYMQVGSRSLASVDELEETVYIMTPEQAMWLARELVRTCGNLAS